MNSNLKKLFLISLFGFFVLFFLFNSTQPILAQSTNEDNTVCAVYFTGIGCPHCANADPVLLKDSLNKYPNLVVIEYEIYQIKGNAQIFNDYCNKYNLSYYKRGIPAIFLGKNNDDIIVGDKPIIEYIKKKIDKKNQNKCLLSNGSEINFGNLNLTNLPGQVKIWRKNRILIKDNKNNKWIFGWNGNKINSKIKKGNNPKEILSELVETDDVPSTLDKINYISQQGQLKVSLSGRNIYFDNAVQFKIEESKVNLVPTKRDFTLIKILSLAAVDAVNPCALAVLILMLTAILAYNPGKRKDVLLAGFAFIASIFVVYFFYGLIIIKFFQVMQFITVFKIWLYKILGGLAILLGILEVKDFAAYKAGGFMTEMPLSLRPKVKKIISRVTSPKGSALTGIIVALFLLPCTIGPYIITGGILSAIKILKTIPWLLLYNLVFVLPMVIIVFFIYLGLKRVEDVSQWKDKNIRKLHLVAGIIMMILGIIMVLNLF